MFKLSGEIMKKLFAFLLFGIIIASQSAYSQDPFHGKVKYGTYNCVKDNQPCELNWAEYGAVAHGQGCPPFIKVNNKNQFNYPAYEKLLTSQYCKFTPTKVQKYLCTYNSQYSSEVYVENGKVVTAKMNSYIGFDVRNDLPKYYQPDKCKKVPFKY